MWGYGAPVLLIALVSRGELGAGFFRREAGHFLLIFFTIGYESGVTVHRPKYCTPIVSANSFCELQQGPHNRHPIAIPIVGARALDFKNKQTLRRAFTHEVL